MKILLFNAVWFIMGIVFTIVVLPEIFKYVTSRKTVMCVMHNNLSSKAINLMKSYQTLGYKTIYYSSENKTKRIELSKVLNENGLKGALYTNDTMDIHKKHNIRNVVYGWES